MRPGFNLLNVCLYDTSSWSQFKVSRAGQTHLGKFEAGNTYDGEPSADLGFRERRALWKWLLKCPGFWTRWDWQIKGLKKNRFFKVITWIQNINLSKVKSKQSFPSALPQITLRYKKKTYLDIFNLVTHCSHTQSPCLCIPWMLSLAFEGSPQGCLHVLTNTYSSSSSSQQPPSIILIFCTKQFTWLMVIGKS